MLNIREQGVRRPGKSSDLLKGLLLLILLCSSFLSHGTAIADIDNKKLRVAIIFSPESSLQKDIARILSARLSDRYPGILISASSVHDETDRDNNDLIVSIGKTGLLKTEHSAPATNKLYIATEPDVYKAGIKPDNRNAVLYITQPYCKQLKLIKLLNKKWKTVSILIGSESPVNNKKIRQCAAKNSLKIYQQQISGNNRLSSEIKTALTHSDVLLAIPDNSIYNNSTVKNILLTSYRYRKPIIAFSESFVRAGALSAIHSNAEQIATTADTIITGYIKNSHLFTKSVNYPESFDISVNKQVFRALDLPVHELDMLKGKLLEEPGPASAGGSK